MTQRGHLTQRQKAKVMLRQNGKCAGCGKRLIVGFFEFDHIQDLQHDGDNELDNWQALCTKPCHRLKTKKGNQAREKADRIAVGGRERKGPPMPGSRDSPWKCKMNGTTERRDE